MNETTERMVDQIIKTRHRTPVRSWIFVMCLFSEGLFFGALSLLRQTHHAGGSQYYAYTFALIALILAVAVGSLSAAWRQGHLVTRAQTSYLLLLIVVASSAGINWARFPESATMPLVLRYFAAISVPAAILALSMNEEALRRLVRPVNIVGIALTLTMLVAYARDSQLLKDSSTSQNFLNDVAGATHLLVGATMSAVYLCNLAQVFSARKSVRALLHLSVMLVNVFLILASGSRGALVSVIVITVVVVLMKRQKVLSVPGMLVMCGSLIFVWKFVLGPLSNSGGLQRIQDLSLTQDQSATHRVEYYSQAWHNILAHPAFGDGVGSFSEISGSYIYPHNVFLEIANDFGAIGLAIFLLISAKLIKRMYVVMASGSTSAQIIALLLANSLIQMQFSGSYTTNGGFWLLFGVMWLKFPHLANLNDADPEQITSELAGSRMDSDKRTSIQNHQHTSTGPSKMVRP